MQKHQKTKIVACFVRHGQTFDNLNHILAGHQPGKLTETGIEQAYYTGDQLKNSQFDHIYVSDLGRTRETYEGIIAKATHLAAITPQYLPLLREKSVGVMVGESSLLMEKNALEQNIPFREYKCDQAESWVDVYHRAYKFLHLLIQKHIKSSQDPDSIAQEKIDSGAQKQQIVRVLVVTHGGYIMETHNAVNWIVSGREPVFENNAKNCHFHEFELGYTGDVSEPIQDQYIQATVLKKNTHKY